MTTTEPTTAHPAKVAFYVDGFNLYHAIDALGDNRLKWLNLWKLAQSFIRQDEVLSSVTYFTALMHWNREKMQRHREYLSALEHAKVNCIVSSFNRTHRHCNDHDRRCKFYDEKKTDVAIATRIIGDCIQNSLGRVILVTADSDQVPTVAAIRGLFSNIDVSIACPPGRKQNARELGSVAHDFKEISKGRLERCLFPRNIYDGAGKLVAAGPAKYHTAD